MYVPLGKETAFRVFFRRSHNLGGRVGHFCKEVVIWQFLNMKINPHQLQVIIVTFPASYKCSFEDAFSIQYMYGLEGTARQGDMK